MNVKSMLRKNEMLLIRVCVVCIPISIRATTISTTSTQYRYYGYQLKQCFPWSIQR